MNDYKALDSTFKGMKFIDLFAGIGGFHLAMQAYEAECVFSSEWDKHAQRTYFENFGVIPQGDITQIKEEDIPSHDILCAGFPCQAFSISGKQKGFEDARGTLFFDIARIAQYHNPKVILLENVRNFTTHDQGNTLRTVKRALDEMGYDIWHQVLNASHFGLPQNRERIYIVAIKKDIYVKDFQFPKPSYESTFLKDIVLTTEETEEYIIHREDMKIDQTKIPGKSIHQDYPLKPVRVGTINKGGQGERIYSEFGHAVTLSAYGGGPGSKTGCYLIDGKVRKLAPRECARLQGFPDNFKIPVSDGQAWKQFGNSVPVNVIKLILKSIIDSMDIQKLRKE